jgi:hypothetical protein
MVASRVEARLKDTAGSGGDIAKLTDLFGNGMIGCTIKFFDKNKN